ncbi:asparaginase [Actinomyces sp. 2119]|uniref:Asparaginase n=1 Tax=Actinomyces lilanjuaniae TaxID=2321394 RepID=A0ABN5PQ86_9ACTO|nr:MULTISPECIES: asparaginase [Actinomyces]AYD90540.1 asparaginase [Actinomyces lilanjuaniae]RJF44008.1 asparaginase [Actinomyces sp. 2119]
MRVHITYTGGTIGMVDSPRGLVPGADLEGWLATLLDGTDLAQNVTMTALDPLIDSSNATPLSWQAVVEDLRAHAASDPHQAFVVLHGTDTMAYTSAALSYALTDFPCPVVITGSQLPLGVVGSDAAPNVTGALRAATSGRLETVALFFGHRLLAGNRATKSSSWAFKGFTSPNAAPLAMTGAPWQWSPPQAQGSGWPRALPYTRHDVVVADLAPGITAQRLEAMLTPQPEAVVLRAFGVGNVPSQEPGLTTVIKETVAAGTAVVVASQCQEAEVLLGHYEAGDALARAGAVGSADMTLEATYAKVQFLLSQGLRGADLAAAVGRSVAGELTEQAQQPG